jgi:hypothetical protein
VSADLVEEVLFGGEPFVERVGDVPFLLRRASRSSLCRSHQLLYLRRAFSQLLRLQPQRVELVAAKGVFLLIHLFVLFCVSKVLLLKPGTLNCTNWAH